jgi:hypothetical protein
VNEEAAFIEAILIFGRPISLDIDPQHLEWVGG